MIRIPTPADLNPTTRRYPRTTDEAFLCDAESAEALFRAADVCRYGALWWAAMLMVAGLAVVVIVVQA